MRRDWGDDLDPALLCATGASLFSESCFASSSLLKLAKTGTDNRASAGKDSRLAIAPLARFASVIPRRHDCVTLCGR